MDSGSAENIKVERLNENNRKQKINWIMKLSTLQLDIKEGMDSLVTWK